MRRTWALIGAAAILAGGCTGSGGGEGRVQAAEFSLVRFDECADLLTHLKAEAAERVSAYGLGGVMSVGLGAVAEVAEGASQRAAAPAADLAAGEDYSTTNVQEEGVDEPDMVKTDGRVLYVASGGHVHAMSAGDRTLLGSLPLEGWPSELLLLGDRLLVFGHGSGRGGPEIARSMILPGYQDSRIWTVDVSDPAAMRVAAEVELEGTYRAARAVDGIARVVVVSNGPSLDFDHPFKARESSLRGPVDESVQQAEEQRAKASNQRLVAESGIEDWIPGYSVPGGASGRLAACDQTYRPASFGGFSTATVFTIDPATGTPDEGAAVLGTSETVYASADSLYLTTTQADIMPMREGPDAPVTDRMRVGDQRTAIHAFDIGDSRSTRYSASGEVPGRLLNQFSMSEHEGVLRVAVTLDQMSEQSSSSVITLRAADGVLEQLGRLDGLGRNEQIYAVRYIGDLAYVVTFRRVDPLHVVDLSDPATPVLRGELHIPGYSAYLHPVGEGLLLGIGQDATDEGRATGLLASLFDVSDPEDPRRIQHWTLPGASSEAEFDHHAFLWWPREGLAVVPVTSFMAEARGGQPFSGALALDVGRDAITERGRIQPPGEVTWSGLRRSLVIGDTLFSVSDQGVLASQLRTLDRIGWTPLPGAPDLGRPIPLPMPVPEPGVVEPGVAVP